MLFETKEFFIDKVQSDDLKEIIKVYNSNKSFLLSHMDEKEITEEWLSEEVNEMSRVGFYSCRILEKSSGKIIGAMDFKIEEEAYLSLLIIHSDFKNKGIGKKVFHAFEDYTKSLKSKCIRIDVVTNYNKAVIDFWIKNGFNRYKDVELNWTGKVLPAVTMKKTL